MVVTLTGIVESFHLFAVISWMVGMLYLPRLYVYHADVVPGSENDKLLQIMERRLLRIIVNPAMIAVFFFGLWLSYIENAFVGAKWLHVKFALVLLLSGIHGFLAYCRKRFVVGRNRISAKQYRIINELIALIMASIIFLACAKPF